MPDCRPPLKGRREQRRHRRSSTLLLSGFLSLHDGKADFFCPKAVKELPAKAGIPSKAGIFQCYFLIYSLRKTFFFSPFSALTYLCDPFEKNQHFLSVLSILQERNLFSRNFFKIQPSSLLNIARATLFFKE